MCSIIFSCLFGSPRFINATSYNSIYRGETVARDWCTWPRAKHIASARHVHRTVHRRPRSRAREFCIKASENKRVYCGNFYRAAHHVCVCVCTGKINNHSREQTKSNSACTSRILISNTRHTWPLTQSLYFRAIAEKVKPKQKDN